MENQIMTEWRELDAQNEIYEKEARVKLTKEMSRILSDLVKNSFKDIERIEKNTRYGNISTFLIQYKNGSYKIFIYDIGNEIGNISEMMVSWLYKETKFFTNWDTQNLEIPSDDGKCSIKANIISADIPVNMVKNFKEANKVFVKFLKMLRLELIGGLPNFSPVSYKDWPLKKSLVSEEK